MKTVVKKTMSAAVVIIGGFIAVAGGIVDIPEAIGKLHRWGMPTWISPADVWWSLFWLATILVSLVVIWTREDTSAQIATYRLAPGLKRATVVGEYLLDVFRRKMKDDESTVKILSEDAPDFLETVAGNGERDVYVEELQKALRSEHAAAPALRGAVLNYLTNFAIRELKAELDARSSD